VGRRSRLGLLCGVVAAFTMLGAGVARAVSTPTTSGGIGASPTSVVVASTTAGAPPTSTAGVRLHFEGKHSGIERMQFATKACPVLDHRLRETFTLTDGTAWDFHAHYCGTIDSQDVWTGVGTFTIATGNGSGLSGNFTDSAHLPSVGVPYVIHVTAGTGTFAGATGSCVLDDHLRRISATTQHQNGIFVCDLH
jgi:hypothetical protein